MNGLTMSLAVPLIVQTIAVLATLTILPISLPVAPNGRTTILTTFDTPR